MIVRFLPEAERELVHAIDYLDSQQPGLGLRFQGAFWKTIEAIRQWPKASPAVTRRARRRILRRYRYGIVYQHREDEILIIAVLHLHRKPGYWRERLT